MLKDFTKIADLVPESEVNVKYKTAAAVESCHILVYWFKIDGKRFGDVYTSKDCSLAVLERIKRNRTVKSVYIGGVGPARWRTRREEENKKAPSSGAK